MGVKAARRAERHRREMGSARSRNHFLTPPSDLDIAYFLMDNEIFA